jgi:hypothetical protein
VDRKKKQIKLSMKALEPEVEEFKPVKKENKRSSRHGKKEAEVSAESAEPKEPEQTAFQIAWQEAMEKADEGKSIKFRRVKANLTPEQSELLDRTLEKRLPTGG